MPAKPPPGPTQIAISSDEEFEQLAGNSAESGFLCVVEVFASWCGSTDAAVSTISRLNADFSGRKLRFYQVNADRVAALERFKAKSKPHFLLYKDVRRRRRRRRTSSVSSRRADPWAPSLHASASHRTRRRRRVSTSTRSRVSTRPLSTSRSRTTCPRASSTSRWTRRAARTTRTTSELPSGVRVFPSMLLKTSFMPYYSLSPHDTQLLAGRDVGRWL